jgi:hypothetical protein
LLKKKEEKKERRLPKEKEFCKRAVIFICPINIRVNGRRSI